MTNPGNSGGARHKPAPSAAAIVPVEHYIRLLLHRKWLVITVFLTVTTGTYLYSKRLPNFYRSEVVILLEPQKVPASYVKATVSGGIIDRLGTLAQQVLSASRLQNIIDSLNLYPKERKSMSREDVITKMRKDISTTPVTTYEGGTNLDAFRITYYGQQPDLVAQVANKLASLFIDENLKMRSEQANGTTEFLENQLQETRKNLEGQEAKLRDFRLQHIGEMPEQQTAELQMLGQVQAQLQMESDAEGRAENQKNLLQAMMSQGGQTVVDLDSTLQARPSSVAGPSRGPDRPQPPSQSAADRALAADRAQLANLRTRYSDAHPDVIRMKKKLEQEERLTAPSAPAAGAPAPSALSVPVPPPPPPFAESADAGRQVAPLPGPAPSNHFNPVIQSQLAAADADIAKHKAEQQRLAKLVAGYRGKLDAIPVREQELTSLTRDYEMSKTHYSQLLNEDLSAQTAGQMETRSKGEQFTVLDPAMPAYTPARPNRALINGGGGLAGLVLGVLAALASELLGMSITEAQDVTDACGINVLGMIPVILTESDRRKRRRRWILGAASATFAALAVSAILVFGLIQT